MGRRTLALLCPGLLAGARVVAGSVPAAAAPACSVTWTVTNQWPGGFTADVAVTPSGARTDGWTLDWTFTRGQRVASLWNGELVSAGPAVRARHAAWNREVAPGATVTVGFVGSLRPGDPNPAPTDIRLNGVTCTRGGGSTDPRPTPTPTPTPTRTATPTPTPTPTTSPTPSPSPSPTPSPTGGFYLVPDSQAARAAAAATGETRRLLDKIATTPSAVWIGDWATADQSRRTVQDVTRAAQAQGTTAVLVVYAIPGRDCGNHSAGGVGTSEYARWVDTVASGIVGTPWVVLEPDALAQLGDCAGQGDRVGYLRYAARSLTQAGARVYVDAGHSAWLSPETAAARLRQVGFDHAVGFALNTSNYRTTAESRAYGERVSALAGGVPFVVDTSATATGRTASGATRAAAPSGSGP